MPVLLYYVLSNALDFRTLRPAKYSDGSVNYHLQLDLLEMFFKQVFLL
jgi:hypothetical protein